MNEKLPFSSVNFKYWHYKYRICLLYNYFLTSCSFHMLGFDLDDAVSLRRYQHEFENLGFIATGGFSTVYKVRHKTDFKIYALKIIQIKPSKSKTKFDQLITKSLRQVQILSSLNHPNILRYFGSWLEADLNVQSHQQQNTEQNIQQCEFQMIMEDCSQQLSGFQFERGTKSSEKCKNLITSKQINRLTKITSDCIVNINKYQKIKIYVLSQLGESSLHNYLNKRNRQRDADIKNIKQFNTQNYLLIGQILEGLAYLHSEGVIHRDIKLNNIIIDEKKQCKIIDFGLAKRMNKYIRSDSDENHQDQQQCEQFIQKHSNRVGTLVFSSPQQVSSYNYDHRTDIYSLAMVIAIMFSYHTTQHQLTQIFANLRNRKLDKFNMDVRLKNILYLCLGKQQQRPTIKEIKTCIKTLLYEQNNKDMMNMDSKQNINLRNIHPMESPDKQINKIHNQIHISRQLNN